MNLTLLKQEIPIQWRIQSCSKSSAKAQCVAYIDARDAMKLLDEVCGAQNWQDEYYQVKDTMFCKVGINTGEQWVWKSDGGDVTDVEAKKGESSDAFKRACVKWGIGRFLYDLETRWIDTNGPKNDSNKFPWAVDKNGQRIYDLTKYLNGELVSNKPHEESSAKPKVESSDQIPADHLIACVCGKPRKFVPPGVSHKGKPYKGFYACSAGKGVCNQPTIQIEDAEQYLKNEYKDFENLAKKTSAVFSDGSPLPTEF